MTTLQSSSNRHRQRSDHELQRGEIERRDWQLWALAILLIMALTLSIVVTRSPELSMEGTQLKSQLDMYLLALCVLAMLFCASYRRKCAEVDAGDRGQGMLRYERGARELASFIGAETRTSAAIPEAFNSKNAVWVAGD